MAAIGHKFSFFFRAAANARTASEADSKGFTFGTAIAADVNTVDNCLKRILIRYSYSQ